MKAPRNSPLLLQSQHEPRWANRRAVGLGVFFGFLIAFAGYMLTGIGWFFAAPLVGFLVAWRLVFGQWPLRGSRASTE